MFIQLRTMARGSTWRSPTGCFPRFSACILSRNFRAPASALRPSIASSIGTVGGSGPRRNSGKARRFIGRFSIDWGRQVTALSPGEATARRTFLLVEDNPDDVELTRRAFARSKVVDQLVVVGDGEEALHY